MYKKTALFFGIGVFLLFTQIVSAADTGQIQLDTTFQFDNGVNITILAPQNFTPPPTNGIQVLSTPPYTLQIVINNTNFQINSTTSINLSNISFYNSGWNWTYTNATPGYVQLNLSVLQNNVNFSLYRNGIFQYSNASSNYGLYYNLSQNGSYSISNTSIPGDIQNLSAATGNFWVNYTWSAGINTDSFNISQNGTWTNRTTITSLNTTVGAHNWSNIIVYGWSASSQMLGASASMSTQVPDNLPTFGNSTLSQATFDTSGSVTITVTNVLDADSDNITSVTAGVTMLGGNEINYTTVNTPGTSDWTYVFTTVTPGTYNVTHFYAQDAYGNGSIATTLQFIVTAQSVIIVQGNSGGGGGYTPPTPAPTSTSPEVSNPPTPQNIINITDVLKSTAGYYIQWILIIIGIFIVYIGSREDGVNGDIVLGFILILAPLWSLWSLGFLAGT